MLVETDPAADPPHRGTLIVEKEPERADLPGLTIRPLEKLGYKASRPAARLPTASACRPRTCAATRGSGFRQLLVIGEGTNEIQQLVIARRLLES